MESLKKKVIPTPLGNISAVADDHFLHLLTFSELDFPVGSSRILTRVEEELKLYFSGKLKNFTIPLRMEGTPFQKKVWSELLKIPYGKTTSYGEIARLIGKPKASRAVGSSNGKNPVVIIVPCHRVISKGSLGGYSHGIKRKQWFLEHEQK